MRKIILSSIYVLIVLLVWTACKKGDGISDPASLGTGSYLTLVATNNTIIDYANLSNSKVSITVNEYGSPVETVKVYVTKGSTSLDKTTWKAVKTFTYSNEITLEVTATEIATALGIQPADLETGATYTLYNQILTKDGRTFDIANTGSDFAGNSNYNMALTWSAVVVCPFDSTGFAGTFEVLEDGWADYSAGDVVAITTGPEVNQITMTVYPNPAYGNNRQPVVVDVDPATGAATVASQVYGDYGGADFRVKTTGSDNWVFSCAGSIKLKLNHATASTNYGDYTLRLKRK